MKRGFAVGAAALTLCLLCGCMPRIRVTTRDTTPAPLASPAPAWGEAEPPVAALPTPALPELTPEAPPESSLTAAQQDYGSVGLLSEPTVLVSVYINDVAGSHLWDEQSMDDTRETLDIAVRWIEEQAAGYGQDIEIYYDDGTAQTEGLRHTYMVQNRLAGGEEAISDSQLLTEFDSLCQTLNTQSLQAYYGTENIGFLLFLPLDGCSFTMVHYTNDGPSFFEEYSCLYRYDMYSGPTVPETPAVYAHEILHLFGAPDLYEGSSDPFVDEELTAYVDEYTPDDIMYDTYELDGSITYGAITQRLTPLVAYRLGLIDHCDELERFPKIGDTPPGVFTIFDTESPRSLADLPADQSIACRPAA